MATLRNHCKAQLRKGALVVGANAHITRTPEIGRVFQAAGFDFVWVDLEHSAHSIDSAGDICLGALDQGITPLVRVGWISGQLINRVICNGAMGVIVPHVDTPEEAEEVVANVKFAPQGRASVPAYFPQFRHAQIDKEEAGRLMNRETLAVVMIESEKAVANAEAIAKVKGVDVLFIGASDLTFDMGLNGQYGHPKVKAACQRVAEAAAKHGRTPGLGGPALSDAALWQEYVRMGFRYISAGSDLGYITSGARATCAFFRGIKV